MGQYDLVRAEADYPEWQGPPRRTLLICTQPRSGSTLLGEALWFAGGLGCPLEYESIRWIKAYRTKQFHKRGPRAFGSYHDGCASTGSNCASSGLV